MVLGTHNFEFKYFTLPTTKAQILKEQTRFATIDNSQLPLFALNHQLICNRYAYWLRDVVSSWTFAFIGYDGLCDHYKATTSWIGIRPVFAIK